MEKQKVIKIISWFFSILIVLVVVLLLHIYSASKSVPTTGLQLSRIDFNEPIDSAEAAKIRSFVGHITGVESTYFNVKSGILVYTFYLNKQTSMNVYQKLIEYGGYKAKRYILNTAEIKSGCPISEEQSFSRCILSYFKNL